MAAIAPRCMITPQDQLKMLVLHHIEEQVGIAKACLQKQNLTVLDDSMLSNSVTVALNIIFKDKTNHRKGDEDFKEDIDFKQQSLSMNHHVSPLTEIAVQRLIEFCPFPLILTRWLIALERLNTLPQKIPPLPENIYQILKSKCSLHFHSNKRVQDSHALYLIPSGTINELANRVRAYGEQFYPNNSLKLGDLHHLGCQALVNISSNDYEWVLMSKDLLRTDKWSSAEFAGLVIEDVSDDESAPVQEPIVAAQEPVVHQKPVETIAYWDPEAFPAYQVPTARQAIAVALLHEVTREEAEEGLYYQSLNELDEEQIERNYTHIQEGPDLFVGGLDSSRCLVFFQVNFPNPGENFGIAPVRKLSEN